MKTVLPEITYCKQHDPDGCVDASLAMILGWSYSRARMCLQYTASEESSKPHVAQGIVLAVTGLRPRELWHGEVWPPAPFAQVHLCIVHRDEVPHGHAVVMLDDGRVLDPWKSGPWALSDYSRVYSVTGFLE